MMRQRLAILISGRGSNMEALLNAAQRDDSNLQPVLVISNKPDAAGLEIARGFGVKAIAIDHKGFKSREQFEQAMDEALQDADVDLIALAGFMRVLTPWFVDRWEGRLLNIHPSLLPKYPGVDTHERALAAGDAEHGCTVHYVTSGVDEGPIVGQARLRILPDDTKDSLAARVLEMEHALYMLCMEAIAKGTPTRPVERKMVMTFKPESGYIDLWTPAEP